MINKKIEYLVTKVLFQSEVKITSVSLYCKIVKETAKAFQFQLQKNKSMNMWIPKSALAEFSIVAENVQESFLKPWYNDDYVNRIYANYSDMQVKNYGRM